MSNTARLLIQCPDQEGLLSQICNFIFYNKGNIVSLQEHVEPESRRFFARVEWDWENFNMVEGAFREAFEKRVTEPFGMEYELHLPNQKTKMAIFVSKYTHCIEDILYRYSSGEWDVEIPVIISNHPDLKYLADRYDLAFHHIPINKESKSEQEDLQLRILKEAGVDLIVLARYMQILSSKLTKGYPNKIINIHHSFLPAFAGAKPYHAAYTRGVKIIGATAHYVTPELDAGPIIWQDISHISHRDYIPDMIIKGRDVEKLVFSRAIKLHLENKVIAHENRTVVFS